MKIAIESNDGVTLKSPYSQTMGYIVCDIESERIEKSEYINIRSAINKPNRKVHSGFRLNDCATVITRGMDNENQSMLKEKGIEVFVTFNTLAKDALRSYLKEKMINEPV
ncbi:MAG: NifB/NifX family molybdenum-iron cluster-binding protein [Ignavibacteriaceae bacterium]